MIDTHGQMNPIAPPDVLAFLSSYFLDTFKLLPFFRTTLTMPDEPNKDSSIFMEARDGRLIGVHFYKDDEKGYMVEFGEAIQCSSLTKAHIEPVWTQVAWNGVLGSDSTVIPGVTAIIMEQIMAVLHGLPVVNGKYESVSMREDCTGITKG